MRAFEVWHARTMAPNMLTGTTVYNGVGRPDELMVFHQCFVTKEPLKYAIVSALFSAQGFCVESDS